MSLLCLFAHHRCASSWSNDILRQLCDLSGWRHRVVHGVRDLDGDLAAYCARERPEVLVFSNAEPALVLSLPPFVGLHLVRDPRDILVSSYYSHCYSHRLDQWPELAQHRRQLQATSKEHGLLLELDCRARQFADMAAWDYAQPNVQECRVETMVPDAVAQFSRLLESWGRLDPGQGGSGWGPLLNRTAAQLQRRAGLAPVFPYRRQALNRDTIAAVVARHSFRNKSGGRERGEGDPAHHYRMGVAGDWRRHFFPELTVEFKRRYGELLVKLGYEGDRDW